MSAEPFYEPVEGCDWIHKTNICSICNEVMPNGKEGFSPFTACDPCHQKTSQQVKQIVKDAREEADRRIAILNKALYKDQKDNKSTFDFSSFLLGVFIASFFALIICLANK